MSVVIFHLRDNLPLDVKLICCKYQPKMNFFNLNSQLYIHAQSKTCFSWMACFSFFSLRPSHYPKVCPRAFSLRQGFSHSDLLLLS